MNFRLPMTAMATLLAGSVAIPAHADDISVTVVNGHPPVFLWVKHLTETFIPTVNAKLEGTEHTITWSEAYGGTLASVGGELEAIEDGLAEIGVVPTVFEPTSLPLQNVSYFTPFGTSDPQVVIGAVDRLHRDIPGMIESWEKYNAEYLGGGFALDNYLLMTNFPVTSIDDLNGRKIGAPGPAVNWLEGTGAVGVAGNLTTYYNDIQTGVFDGTIVFPTAAAPAKLQEVASHILITDFGAQYAGSLVANKDWYDGQPAEVQEALRAGAEAYTAAYISEQNARVAAALKQMEDNGGTITKLSDEERARWAAALPQIADVWAKNADGQGLPGSEVLDAYIGILKEAEVPLARDWSQR
ncbi:C4-dicarboxylate TRAP transporter substrate-binding protein [Mesorhizobium sp. CAU 1732]|uniref:C4-dicarboxylate TRAP transporter substrate-binding protein n=1 Tax=Mesorhizobium sp. CAU 1732 TaxID=3140358 RepID=UPI0032619C0B